MMKEYKFDEPATVCVRNKYKAQLHRQPNVDEVVEEHPSDGRLWLLLKRQGCTVEMIKTSDVEEWWKE